MRAQKGFTLMELLVVVIILGVLVSVALPRYNLAVERTRSAEGVQTLTALLSGQKSYFLDNNFYTTQLSDLDVEIPSSNIFNTPTLGVPPDDPLAAVVRSSGAYQYQLSIDQNGVITCVTVAGDDICGSLGY